MGALTAERARLGDALRELEFAAHDLAGRVAQADVLVPELEGRLAQRDEALVACRADERRAATDRRELQRQLDEQCERRRAPGSRSARRRCCQRRCSAR